MLPRALNQEEQKANKDPIGRSAHRSAYGLARARGAHTHNWVRPYRHPEALRNRARNKYSTGQFPDSTTRLCDTLCTQKHIFLCGNEPLL